MVLIGVLPLETGEASRLLRHDTPRCGQGPEVRSGCMLENTRRRRPGGMAAMVRGRRGPTGRTQARRAGIVIGPGVSPGRDTVGIERSAERHRGDIGGDAGEMSALRASRGKSDELVTPGLHPGLSSCRPYG